MKYLINCKFCGALLLKTSQPLLAVLEAEIKCQNCKKVIYLPSEVNVVPETKKEETRSGLKGG